MSLATAILRREHEQILRALDVMIEVAGFVERGQPLLPASLSAIQQFFLFVAHRNHYDKEEQMLFPRLRERGFPESAGCIRSLLEQHAGIAEVFQQMVSAAEAYEEGDRDAALLWCRAARQYAEGLRRHIRHEDQVLLGEAERLLSEAEQKELASLFARVDERAYRAGLDEVVIDFERVAQAVSKPALNPIP